MPEIRKAALRRRMKSMRLLREYAESQRLEQALEMQVVVDHPGAVQGGEQVEQHADAKGYGESLDRAGAEQEQGHSGDQGGHMGIDDGPEGLVVAGLDGGVDRLPRANSSRMRSKISTLESTAMPMERTMPAMPGRVRVARKRESAASIKSRFSSRARLAIAPEIR